MKPPEPAVRKLVAQWIKKGQADLGVAEALTKGASRYNFAAAFHAQQAAEKFLKAFLTRHQIEFPKAHNIGKLLDLIAAVAPDVASSLHEATVLTPYGVEYRYPGDSPEPSEEDARKAVRLARYVRDVVLVALGDYLGRE